MNPTDFQQLYKAHYRIVRNAARSYGVPASDADDVTQEVFLRACEPLSQPGSEGRVLPLLIHIARNEACRFQERWHREQYGRALLGALEGSKEGPTAEELMRVKQQCRFVMDLIDDLDPARRTVFVMVEIEEKRLSEIAEALQIPLTTVESRLRDARSQLLAAVNRARAGGKWPAIILFSDISKTADALWCRIRQAVTLRRAAFVCAIAALPGLAPLAPAESLPLETRTQETAPSTTGAQVLSAAGDVALPVHPPSSIGAQIDPAPAVAASHAPPKTAPVDHAARELLLVHGARRLLFAGDIDAALKDLLAHKAQYPDGYLSQLREELLLQIERHREPLPGPAIEYVRQP